MGSDNYPKNWPPVNRGLIEVDNSPAGDTYAKDMIARLSMLEESTKRIEEKLDWLNKTVYNVITSPIKIKAIDGGE